jgi:hypothetical protein
VKSHLRNLPKYPGKGRPKQKIGAFEGFDWKERDEAEVFTMKWRDKGYRVFDMGEGTDTYVLMAAKRKPSYGDIEGWYPGYLRGPSKSPDPKEIKDYRDLD